MSEVPALFRPSPSRPKPFVIAHRGNSVLAPENTLAAFRRAIDDGADILETDLHLTRDGVFACIHDGTVDRTTDGTGTVEGMTVAELKALSASYGRPGFEEERVPTLGELLEILPENVGLLLELKTDRFLEAGVVRQLLGQLEAAGARERTGFISWQLPRVLAVRALVPGSLVGIVTVRRFTPRVPVSLLGPLWPILLLNPFYTWWTHRRGAFVCPLDVTPRRRLWLYRLLGCDAVIANDPGAVVRALGRHPS